MDDVLVILGGAGGAVGIVGYALGRWRGKRQQKIAVLEQRLVDLEKDQGLRLQTTATRLETASSSLKDQLEQFVVTFNGRLERLEARLVQSGRAHDERLAEARGQLDGRLTQLDGKLVQLDGKLASAVTMVLERLESLRVELRRGLNDAVEGLQEKLTGHEEVLRTLEKALASSSAASAQKFQAQADADQAAQEGISDLRKILAGQDEKLAAQELKQELKVHELGKAQELRALSIEKDLVAIKVYSAEFEAALREQLGQLEARIEQSHKMHDDDQKKRLDEVIVELGRKLTVTTSELNRKLSSGVLERMIREVLEIKPETVEESPLEIPMDLLKAAVDEQERREGQHHLLYRNDQRVTAVQQRLSREIGERAFGAATHFAIVKELKKRDMV